MIKTFIFVEDGSVDTDQLTNDLGDDTMVVVYRQGSTMPTIVQPKEPVKFFLDDQDKRIYEPTKQALEQIARCFGQYYQNPANNEQSLVTAMDILKKLRHDYFED